MFGERGNNSFHPDENLHVWSESCNSFWFPISEWRELTFSRQPWLRRDLDPGDLSPEVTLWLMAGMVGKRVCSKPLSTVGGGAEGEGEEDIGKRKTKNWSCH